MNNSDWKIIVIVNDDRKCAQMGNTLGRKFPDAVIGFAHAPIQGNVQVTVNDLYDNLKSCKNANTVVFPEVMVSQYGIITEAIVEFEKGCPDIGKPLLRRQYEAPKCEWCGRCDLACELIVAKTADLFKSLSNQFSGNK